MYCHRCALERERRSIDDPSYPHCVSARVVCSLAQVVKGILDIAGLSIDADTGDIGSKDRCQLAGNLWIPKTGNRLDYTRVRLA